jgi:hypothetical protein
VPDVIPAVPPVAVNPAIPLKTNLKLLKPVDMQLAYGKMKLPAGTAVKLVSREGNMVKINYLNTILTVPAASTDIDVAPPVVPGATAPALPAVPPVAPMVTNPIALPDGATVPPPPPPSAPTPNF